MRTSISKKLLAGALSVMMVLSLVAPTGAQAASKYSITKKASITAEKTNTYTIKGVKKAQYVKMTYKNYKGIAVKYNGETVTKSLKINGGKNIKLKVTAPDKVAKYNAKVTFKVYSKKTKKVVKTLKIKSAVKVTELKVLSVEKASTSGKYLVAYFNKALETLKVADVTVREKDTNKMLGVEAVTLSSDGKSATIALVGDETVGVNGVRNVFVRANTDYTFAVSQKGVTATTTFTVDEVEDEVCVEKTDASRRVITVGGIDDTVPENITVDYEEILGRTVTFWYNQNFVITKLNIAKETVVYGGFKETVDADAKTDCFTDLTTGKKYYTQNNWTGKLFDTCMIDRLANAGAVEHNFNVGATNNATYAYAKLVLNSNNTIRRIVAIPAWTGSILVGSVNGNAVVDGAKKTEVNLTDFIILKDGKTSSVAEIKENDVVFYSTTKKVAEIYTNATTGKLNAVYENRFKFNDVTYNFADTYDAPVKYLKASAGLTAITAAYMNGLLKAGKDITVYFNRKGQPCYVAGETAAAEVTTTSKEFVVMEAVKAYEEKLDTYARFVGSDGTAKVSFDVDLDKVAITNEAGKTFEIGELDPMNVDNEGNDKTKYTYVKDFTVTGTGNPITSTTIVANIIKADGTAATPATRTVATTNLETQVGIGQLMTVTTDKKTNEVVAIDFTHGTTATANLTSKLKTLNGMQLSASCPIYYYDATKGTVKVVEYGKFSFNAIDKANVTVYGDGKDVSAVVFNAAGLSLTDETVVEKFMVVSSAEKNSQGALVELNGVIEGKEVSYTAFNKTLTNTLNTGDIVVVSLTEDLKNVIGVSALSTADYDVVEGTVKTDKINQGKQSFELSGTTYTIASNSVPTIVKINDENPVNKKVEIAEFSALLSLKEANTVKVKTIGHGSNYVDTIIIVKADAKSSAIVASEDAAAIAASAEALANPAVSADEKSLTLAASDTTHGTAIAWTSSDVAKLTNAGAVVGDVTANVTMTATISKGEATAKTVVFTVAITSGKITNVVNQTKLDAQTAAKQAAANEAAAAAHLALPTEFTTPGGAATNTTDGYAYSYSIELAVGHTPAIGGAPTASIASADGKITITAGTSDSSANQNVYTITVTATKDGVNGIKTYTLTVKDDDSDAFVTPILE